MWHHDAGRSGLHAGLVLPILPTQQLQGLPLRRPKTDSELERVPATVCSRPQPSGIPGSNTTRQGVRVFAEEQQEQRDRDPFR